MLESTATVTLSSFPSGELCPVNGRSPGSVSTQHSSPRSDAASAPATAAANIPVVASLTEGSAVHTSDVVINRKENEGFGFVIISSLNRPENAAVISESQSDELKSSDCTTVGLCINEYLCVYILFKSLSVLRSFFLPYVFWHITRSVSFVLFQQFINHGVQLIQHIPARTLVICTVLTF